MWDVEDTIVALATPRAGGCRGIIRVSGPGLLGVLPAVVFPEQPWEAIQQPPARVWSAQCSAGDVLGEVSCELYLWPTARSYTRQPAAELHLIGSLPVLDAVLEQLCRHGARLAQPGEFTLRAFLAGRLDLTQAEAVLGVIDADSSQELGTALTQLAGGLAGPLNRVRNQLLDLLAHLEAGLDFVEEDIQFITPAELLREIAVSSDEVEQLLNRLATREWNSAMPTVVLRGLPNAGKSSLFNALLGVDRSLVSPQPSTTRDYVSAPLRCGAMTVELVDTAGVEESTDGADSIESAAQRLGAGKASQADLELLCLDAQRALTDWETRELSRHRTAPRIVVWTKCDAGPPQQVPSPADRAEVTSSRMGAGLDPLRLRIADELSAARSTESAVMRSTSLRCRGSLVRALEGLVRARELVTARLGEELVAAELRHTLTELGEVVGAVYTDDILDRVFSRFCIGK